MTNDNFPFNPERYFDQHDAAIRRAGIKLAAGVILALIVLAAAIYHLPR